MNVRTELHALSEVHHHTNVNALMAIREEIVKIVSRK
jgi:hypothetical protein